MIPITASVATVSALEILRGGARLAAVSPPPSRAINLNKMYQDFYQWNEVLRFFVSGNVGSVIFFALERFIFGLLNRNLELLPVLMVEYKDSVSFFVAYAIQIVTQHLLNAFLVYGMQTISTRKKYFKTLIACYTTYGTSAVGSTVLQTVFLKTGMNRSIAFVITLWSFACINFFILKYLNTRIVRNAAKEKAANDDTKKRSRSKPNGGRSRENAQSVRGGATAATDLHNFVLCVAEPVVLLDQ